MPADAKRPGMRDTDRGVAAKCGDCRRQFVVSEEPACCPYCRSGEVEAEHGVVVRPA
jgi:Zn finger protein HypA/HybF involved in hydrogenase expression